jgi:hypothetical protein
MNRQHLATIVFGVLLACFAAAAGVAADDSPPASPVKLIFIHHSTGGNWLADPNPDGPYGGLGLALMDNNYSVNATNYGWGPNGIGDRTDIPNWPEWFTGSNSDAILTALYNENGQNVGDFGDWSRPSTGVDGENTIVMFKSCFPNSDLYGNPTDPPNTTANDQYTVGNAKAVYNDILTYFQTRQDKLFVVITAPPQLQSDYSADYQTAAQRAANARAINDWLVNDWLDDYAYANVAVFDYFNVLTAAGNHHRYTAGAVEHVTADANNFAIYTADTWDSHPSTTGHQKATDEFVPLLNYYYNRWQAGSDPVDPDPVTPDRVTLSGSVTYDGTDLCAMVLANGQYMFTCNDSLGQYSLDVPTDTSGQVTLYAFCSGRAPFKQVLTPSTSVETRDIAMTQALAGSPAMTLTHTVGASTRPGWVTLSGSATYDGTPLNMMVLANGQHLFTPADTGAYTLEVPLDNAGQITLFGFCSGMQPFKVVITP